MKIHFHLFQKQSPKKAQKAVKSYFKLEPCHELFSLYTNRLKHYRSLALFSGNFESFEELINSEQHSRILCCDTLTSAKSLTSLEVSKKVGHWELSGVNSLHVLVGAASGFSESERSFLKSKNCLFWSLGALTLPHDLAAVVAAEQIYRAYTIIKKEPYHLGH